MKKSLVIGIILIILIIIGGYFIYQNYLEVNKEIIPFEKHETLTGKIGEGFGVDAICPEGTKAVSGGCTVHSDGIRAEDSQLIKTKFYLKYYNAWQCGFGFLEEGSHAVTATVNCK